MSTNDVSRRQFMRAAGGVTLAAGATAAAGRPAAAQNGTQTGGGGTGNGTNGGMGNETGGGGAGNETGGTGNESGDGGTGNESGDGGGGGGGGNVVPEFGSFLSGANGYSQSGVQDARGEDSVTISVGAGEGYAFDPATVWVSPGTTLVWEWTGQGGGHNILVQDGPAGFSHEDTVEEEGYTYEYQVTEDDAGITTYYCNPHVGQGMKGGVAVGDGVPTTELQTEASGPAITIPGQALSLTVATLIAMASTLGLGYFLMKFGGDYEQ